MTERDLSRLVEQSMSLRLHVEGLAEEVQSLTAEREHALRRYGRARIVCKRLLGRAAGIQQRGSNLAVQIYGQKAALRRLQKQAETLEFWGADVTSIRADLREAEQVISCWGSAPDAAGQAPDVDDSHTDATRGEFL